MEQSFPKETLQSGNTDERTTPINALPGELFIEILLETIELRAELVPQLHSLAAVCRYWFQSIISNPRFWYIIDLDARHLAPLVIRRNPNGPLSVECWATPSDNPADDPGEFLEVARGQAHRWDSLELGNLKAEHMRLFDIPTPALEYLSITDNSETGSIFPLPYAPKLKHVIVWGMELPWDSPFLRGLKSISINFLYSTRPSLQEIGSILSESPTLEWFAFKKLTSAAPLDEESEQFDGIISLPHLQGLDLDLDANVSLLITSTLLKIIDAPRCRILKATISPDDVHQLGPTFTALAFLPMQAAKHIHIQYRQENAHLRIGSTRSLPPTNSLSPDGWQCEGDEARVQFIVNQIPHSGGSLASVFDTLALFLNPTENALELCGFNGPDIVDLFNDHPAIWNSAAALSMRDRTAPEITTALRFLANPIVEDGRSRWPCPQLTSLRIHCIGPKPAAEVASAVLEFLEKRSATGTTDGQRSGSDPGLQLDMPVRMESIEAKQAVIDLLQGAKIMDGVQLLGCD